MIGLEKSSTPQDKPLNFIPDGMTPGFDYSNFDAQTVEDLHLAESEYQNGKKMAARGYVRMGEAVAIAHDALCSVVAQCDNSKHGNRGEDSFRQWCLSIGITKDTAYRLLQISAMFDSSSPRQQEILKELPPTLLYSAAKPSAPEELVEKVKNGEITTNKAYQDLLKVNQQLRTDRVNAMNEADRARNRLEEAQSAMQAAESARDAALADVQGLSEQNRRLKAENADLKKGVTVTAVIDEEEVDRRAAEKAWGLADARNAELQAEKNEVERRNAELEQQLAEALTANDVLAAQAQTSGRDPIEDGETTDSFCVNLDSGWSMARPAYTRLVGTGEDFNRRASALYKLCDRIKSELVEMIKQNDKETLYD